MHNGPGRHAQSQAECVHNSAGTHAQRTAVSTHFSDGVRRLAIFESYGTITNTLEEEEDPALEEKGNILTHVLTHTGISANGQSITEWIYDRPVLRKSGLKRAKKHRTARILCPELSS